MVDTERSRSETAEAARLIARLRQTLRSEQVIDDPEQLRKRAADMLTPGRGGSLPPVHMPLAAAAPHSTEEVAATVRIAAELAVPIVAFGGGTGLMGGARTTVPGLVLDLRALNRVHGISAEDRTAHVDAGVVLRDLGEAAAPHGLIVGHDPWTYPIATVGGTISTNGLGYLGGRYGSMGDQVLGLTVVLADGTIVRTRSALRSSTGPRLRALFAGAEGTLGVITEAVLRLWPRPETEAVLRYDFVGGFDRGFRAVEALVGAGVQPAMIDFGQTRGWDEPSAGSVAPDEEPGILHLAFHGLDEEVEALVACTDKLLAHHGARRRSHKKARRFWDERHVVAEQIRARQESGGERSDWPPRGMLVDFLHVALPASRVLPVKAAAQALLLARGISVAEWGLWHGPELFSIATFMRDGTDDAAARMAEGSDAMLRLVQAHDGSMEYVHGAGLRLAHLMPEEHGAGMDVLRGIKRALDPSGLLNPGKLGL